MSESTPPLNLRLGKQEHQFDERTLMMAKFVLPEIRIPEHYDFDKGKSPFQLHMWANDQWGDCVIAAEANALLRNERIEQRKTIPLTDSDVVARYRALTGAASPGDARDTGLVMLDAMRNWYHDGFSAHGRNYSIAAYGEINPHEEQSLRAGIYALHGVHFGFSLPLTAATMTNDGVWDYKGETGPKWQPGSWGGHCVFAKAYTKDYIEVLTWGMKVKVTNAFVDRYADEAWAVVDNFDSWRAKQTIDVEALKGQLSTISSKVNQ